MIFVTNYAGTNLFCENKLSRLKRFPFWVVFKTVKNNNNGTFRILFLKIIDSNTRLKDYTIL